MARVECRAAGPGETGPRIWTLRSNERRAVEFASYADIDRFIGAFDGMTEHALPLEARRLSEKFLPIVYRFPPGPMRYGAIQVLMRLGIAVDDRSRVLELQFHLQTAHMTRDLADAAGVEKLELL